MNIRTLSSIFALCGVSLAMSGCVPADNSISISGLIMGEGSASEDGFSCEWDPGDSDLLVAQYAILDLKLLAEVGHAPFAGLGLLPTGSFAGVIAVGNTLSAGGNASTLDKNENGIYLKEIAINWTIDGESKYKPGKASSPSDPCNGNGLRLANTYIETGLAATPVTVEMLNDKIPTTPGVTELSCLLGVLGEVNGGDTSVPTEFIVEIQAFGETAAGVNVESPVLKVPVLACEGCAEQFGTVLNFLGRPSGATPMCSITG